jgi:hypothetical protein
MLRFPLFKFLVKFFLHTFTYEKYQCVISKEIAFTYLYYVLVVSDEPGEKRGLNTLLWGTPISTCRWPDGSPFNVVCWTLYPMELLTLSTTS